jgi:polyisoprenoid-binding protein YceI
MRRWLVPACAVAIFCGCKAETGSNLPQPDPKNTQGTKSGEGIPIRGQDVNFDNTNSKITFVGTKPDGKHDGGFDKFSGTVSFPNRFQGKIQQVRCEIDATSLTSDVPKLTDHLKNQDFFNVKEHPTITFVSTKIDGDVAETGPAKITITGDLTMLGKTKPVKFEGTFEFGKSNSFTFVAECKLSRKEFGMSYGEGKINDEVSIKVSLGK